ncbi:MAG: transcription elongation factor GreA [Dehalococcoidia bacterium]|nr:transcription elongation factor GreA [Dehalococcoidia bacterium]
MITVGEGAKLFLASLSTEARQAYSQEVNRFSRWYGPGNFFSQLGSLDVELYSNELGSSSSDPTLRAEAIKAFLVFARQQSWTASNLATLVKARKKGARKESGAESRQAKAVHLTAEGHDKIKNELGDLIKERPGIIDELQRARADKDFRENAPLDAARQHQAHVEGRIQQLEATLRAAVIIQSEDVSETKAGMGCKVVVRDLTYDEEITYTLVSPKEVNLKVGKISVASPTGKALLDKQAGEEVHVEAPAGIMKYRVERVER